MLYLLILGLAVVVFLCIVEAVIYWNKARKERKALTKKLIAAENRRKVLESERKQLSTALEGKAAEINNLQEQIETQIRERGEERRQAQDAARAANERILDLNKQHESNGAELARMRDKETQLNKKGSSDFLVQRNRDKSL